MSLIKQHLPAGSKGSGMRLYGKNPVLERIKANPRSIHKLYFQNNIDLSDLVLATKQAKLDFVSVDKKWIEKECGKVHSQGVVAEVDDFLYVPLQTIIDECLRNVSIPVLLDRITDPQNLGAIIRTLACLGGFSLVLPEFESAEVNETVLRVANGGENYVKISMIPNLVNGIRKIKEENILAVGAVAASEGVDIAKADLQFPLCIVIGSEGTGIRPGIDKVLDIRVSVPMKGAPLSYNAAIASALVCYELEKRRAEKS